MIRIGQSRVATVVEDMIVAVIIGLQAEPIVAGTDVQSYRFRFLDLESVLTLFSPELRE
jgi:hypothetical protein